MNTAKLILEEIIEDVGILKDGNWSVSFAPYTITDISILTTPKKCKKKIILNNNNMITITEIKKVLEKKGYKVSRQAVIQWVTRNRVDAIQIDNSLVYSLDDVMPFINKRVQTTEKEVQELLKDIRTILIK